MRKIVLYTYNIDERRFSQTSNLMIEREVVNIESRDEHELIFAVGTVSGMHACRIPIASRPGMVYFDKSSSTYRVWFDEPNKDAALEAIGNHILDQVAPAIRTHRSFIKRLQEEKESAMELLNKVPTV